MVNSERSYVICHMMTTIDGRIDSGVKGIDALGEYYNLYSQLEHEFKPQAWMCGRVTTEMFATAVGTALPDSSKEITTEDFYSSQKGENFMVAVDTKGLLRWENNVLTFGDQSKHHLIVVVSSASPKEFLSYLQDKDISYVFGGEDTINFSIVFNKLKNNFKIDTLALEGGGLLNGSVLDQDLIDEISLLVCPVALNRSGVPTIFERETGNDVNLRKFSLLEAKKLEKDTVWLRYLRKFS